VYYVYDEVNECASKQKRMEVIGNREREREREM
jgi:hypothetical protein